MLYIFHVDTGTMMTFDMNLALESVSQLKDAIERICGIPGEKQVLLASGGESLEPNARVCSYSVGTDTSPIFLFSKSAIESSTPPSPSIDYGSDADMKEEVESSMNLPASISTVAVRSQLAQLMCELAREQSKVCEKLVHDQHMQQQGWAAVVANLDDITAAFKTRSDIFEQSFKQHLETRDQFINMLESFDNDIETLGKIPVLPALLEKEREEIGDANNAKIPLTLLQWISSKDHEYSLQQIAENCRKGLDQFDSKVLDGLKAEVTGALDAACASDLREIKGLEERLYGLEKFRCDTKKIVQEQTDLAQAFLQNQARASNLGDPSILPDLCASHKRQLYVMLDNHHHLRDIRRRCVKAKQELSTNLYHRLKCVMIVESKICEMDVKLVFYHESIKRLRRHLEVLQQLHMAPSVYLTAVAEVVRRRTFSQAFLLWANDLACQLCAVHSEEVARRKHFQSQFEGHFLASLFPGLEDSPPPFATQAPQLFDSNLPKLSVEDIESLREKLPDLALSLSIPDLSSITQFFLSRSVTNLKPESSNAVASIEDRIVQAVTAVGLNSNLDPALLQPAENIQSSGQSGTTTHPISDRGFESETDTEEFEKVGQSPCDATFEKRARLRNEGDGVDMRGELQRLGGVVGDVMTDLRSDMGQLKQWVLCERTELLCLFQQLTTAYRQRNEELTQELEHKDREIERLQSSNYEVEARLKHLIENGERERLEREELEQRVCEAQRAREAAVKDVTERLNHTHKTEVEAIRSRYRLYASQSIERSTSDLSLEKIERGEMIEKTNHESIINQLKEELLSEKERAINEERAAWEARLDEELKRAKMKADTERQVFFNETVRRVVAEKDRQMDTMRAREMSLVAECTNYKDTIHRLTDNSGSIETVNDSLVQRVQMLETQKARLLAELAILKGIPVQRAPYYSGSSSSILSATDSEPEGGCRDAATSPEPSPPRSHIKKKLTRSTTSLVQQGKVSIGSCNVGDAVLVVWDEKLNSYTILQDSMTLFFLHPDCLEVLSLTGTNPRRLYSTGEVVQKEYCQAKKEENRYNVPKGSKFYRVLVKPLGNLSRSQHSQLSSSDPSS